MLDSNGFISNGHIYFGGEDLATYTTNDQWAKIRGKRIATIFQDPMTSLNPLLTIGFQISEVLMLHHGLSKAEAKEEAIRLLEKVKIPNAADRYNDYPFQYSGGMRQRVALIRTLAVDPDILLLGEPFSALDYQTRILVSDDVYKIIKNEHKMAILVNHDISEALSYKVQPLMKMV